MQPLSIHYSVTTVLFAYTSDMVRRGNQSYRTAAVCYVDVTMAQIQNAKVSPNEDLFIYLNSRLYSTQ